MQLRRRGLLWFLVFVLVTAQTLAWMHRSVHGSEARLGGAAPLEDQHHAGVDESRGAHRGLVTSLAAGHDDSPSCYLFDQLSQGCALFALPPAVLPPALSLYRLPWFQGEAVARWAALFDARGPPALR